MMQEEAAISGDIMRDELPQEGKSGRDARIISRGFIPVHHSCGIHDGA